MDGQTNMAIDPNQEYILYMIENASFNESIISSYSNSNDYKYYSNLKIFLTILSNFGLPNIHFSSLYIYLFLRVPKFLI